MKRITTTLVILIVSTTLWGEQAQSPIDFGGQTVAPYELSTILPKTAVPDDVSKPIRVSSGYVAGGLIRKTFPVIPPEARCLRVSGVVVMHAIIGRDGHVKSVEAVSGADVMRQPYTDAVRQWMYRPF